MIKTIVVSKRSDDFHACIENHPEIWERGKTLKEAVSNLILYHTEEFNIKFIIKT